MADLFENPMQLMGFEFVEFASPTPNVLEPLFEKMGFTLVARHRSKDVLLFRQATSTSSSTTSRIAKLPTLPPSTAPAPAAWRSASRTRTRRTTVR